MIFGLFCIVSIWNNNGHARWPVWSSLDPTNRTREEKCCVSHVPIWFIFYKQDLRRTVLWYISYKQDIQRIVLCITCTRYDLYSTHRTHREWCYVSHVPDMIYILQTRHTENGVMYYMYPLWFIFYKQDTQRMVSCITCTRYDLHSTNRTHREWCYVSHVPGMIYILQTGHTENGVMYHMYPLWFIFYKQDTQRMVLCITCTRYDLYSTNRTHREWCYVSNVPGMIYILQTGHTENGVVYNMYPLWFIFYKQDTQRMVLCITCTRYDLYLTNRTHREWCYVSHVPGMIYILQTGHTENGVMYHMYPVWFIFYKQDTQSMVISVTRLYLLWFMLKFSTIQTNRRNGKTEALNDWRRQISLWVKRSLSPSDHLLSHFLSKFVLHELHRNIISFSNLQ